MRTPATIAMLALLLVPTFSGAVAAQDGTTTTQGELLQRANQVSTEKPLFPELGIAHYLAVSLLQQEEVASPDLNAASRALDAIGGASQLIEQAPPETFEESRRLIQDRYVEVNRTVNGVTGVSGSSAEVWETVEVLVRSAIERWGVRVGDEVLELARAQGEEQDIQGQLTGFRLAGDIFRIVGAPARAAAADAQEAVLQLQFEEDIAEAERLHGNVDQLLETRPAASDLVSAIFWYDDAGQAREEAPRAMTLYGVYGRDEARSEVEATSAQLAAAQDQMRSEMLAVLIPIHLAIAGLAGGTIFVLQRYERDIRDVMLGTEIALLEGAHA